MEYYEHEPVSLYLNNLKLIEKVVSSKQTIQLLKHPWLGKVLIINGEIQHIEKYQVLYHELLVHLPIAFIPIVEDVLILGGGSLFAAYEVLKYPTVKSITLCDHDHNVLDVMERHYPHASAVRKDPKFALIEQDADDFIHAASKKYDLIINDCFNLALKSDEDGVSYFNLMKNLCTDNGVCVNIIYRHIFDRKTTIDTLKYLHQESRLALSLITVPEYPGILHLETIWGKFAYISQKCKEVINQYQKMWKESPNPFTYYSTRNLPYYLYLPPYISNMFNL
ncbi:spermidine synthase [Hungatella hathewayi]|uniref:spermidine synthase n=1 Tax=Hungatella hathewayi TaxID=154046 RepID=UPI0035614310